jgi:hypothetical protein
LPAAVSAAFAVSAICGSIDLPPQGDFAFDFSAKSVKSVDG